MTGRNAAEMDDSMDGSDLRARVVQLEQAQAAARLTVLESWKQQAAVADAHREGQWLNMKQKLDDVSLDVGDIKGTLTWVSRLIIGGILAAVLAFMVKGGFNVPPL